MHSFIQLFLLVILLAVSPAGSSQVPHRPSPVFFEVNQGQWPQRVRYAYRDSRSSVFLSPDEAVLVIAPPRQPGAGHTASDRTSVVRLKFTGADPGAIMRGSGELPTVVNYVLTGDPDRWQTGVATFSKVLVENAYPHVDLLYRGVQRRLEYDLIVHPGGDPEAIGMRFEGVDDLRLDPSGNLVLSTGAGEIVQPRPVIYQEIGGIRAEVDGGYQLDAGGHVRFRVSDYDPSVTLVIDPQFPFVYFTYLGGGNGIGEHAWSIAVNAQGEAYVAGETPATDYPTTAGAHDTAGTGCGPTATCAFVTRLDASGSSLVYSTYLGGTARDVARGIGVDAAGDAYVTGFTYSTDFPTTAQAFQPQPLGQAGMVRSFVTRLGPAGQLVYSTYLGGSWNDSAYAIAVGAGGHAYVTGSTVSTDFPVTQGAFQSAPGGHIDAFVSKLDPAGANILYSTYLGGSSWEYGKGIAVDSSGHAYVTGSTHSTDYPTTPGAHQTLAAGHEDVFVTKLNPDGSGLAYSTLLGGIDDDFSQAIDVDSLGSAYVAGYTRSADFDTTAGAFSQVMQGSSDAFVSKLTANAGALEYSTFLGGPALPQDTRSEDRGWGLAVDPNGAAFVVGETASADFPVTPDGESCVMVNGCGNWFCSGTPLAFVTALAPNGASLVFSSYLGADTGIEGAEAVAVDALGNAYVTGYASSQGLATSAAYDSQPDAIDGFVAKVAARLALHRPLEVRLLAPQRVEPWVPAEFNVVIANESALAAADVAVKACFAGGEMAFAEATAKHQVDGCCAVFTLGDVGAGESAQVAVSVTARETARYRMFARATDSSGAANHSSVEIEVGRTPSESGSRLGPWQLTLIALAIVAVLGRLYASTSRTGGKSAGR